MRGQDIEKRPEKGSAYAIEERESYWISWLIPVFVVANVAMFIVVMYINNCPKHIRSRGDDKCVARFLRRFSFQPLGENPLFGPSSSTMFAISTPRFLALRLERLGGLKWDKVVHQHQGWRLISCVWLHAGLIHLLVNMLSLVFIGIRLEQNFGFVRIGIIYLLSGFGGSVLSALFIQNSISVGASGALFGLLGAMLSELMTNWSMYTNKVAALLTLIMIVVINLGVGILPHVDNFAHIGGFLTGILLGFILLPHPQLAWLERHNPAAGIRGVTPKYKGYQYVLLVVSLVLLIVGFSVGLVMLFRGVSAYERCHWCRYLSCVPTSKWKCDAT